MPAEDKLKTRQERGVAAHCGDSPSSRTQRPGISNPLHVKTDEKYFFFQGSPPRSVS